MSKRNFYTYSFYQQKIHDRLYCSVFEVKKYYHNDIDKFSIYVWYDENSNVLRESSYFNSIVAPYKYKGNYTNFSMLRFSIKQLNNFNERKQK